jgi:hypothetical protein
MQKQTALFGKARPLILFGNKRSFVIEILRNLGDIELESVLLIECCYVLFIDELCHRTLYMKIHIQRESAYSTLWRFPKLFSLEYSLRRVMRFRFSFLWYQQCDKLNTDLDVLKPVGGRQPLVHYK